MVWMEVFLALGFAAHPHCFVKVIEVSEDRGLIIGGYLGPPPPTFLAPTDAGHARYVSGVLSLVLAVGPRRHVTKVFDAVIGAITVDVINKARGPRAVGKGPHHTMGVDMICFIFPTQVGVDVALTVHCQEGFPYYQGPVLAGAVHQPGPGVASKLIEDYLNGAYHGFQRTRILGSPLFLPGRRPPVFKLPQEDASLVVVDLNVP